MMRVMLDRYRYIYLGFSGLYLGSKRVSDSDVFFFHFDVSVRLEERNVRGKINERVQR